MSIESQVPMTEVKRFVTEDLAMGQEVNQHDNLVEKGIIDSIRLIRLVTFLEETYGICVPDEAMVAENFCSFDAIQSLIARQRRKEEKSCA